jgi:hypothetical protein
LPFYSSTFYTALVGSGVDQWAKTSTCDLAELSTEIAREQKILSNRQLSRTAKFPLFFPSGLALGLAPLPQSADNGKLPCNPNQQCAFWARLRHGDITRLPEWTGRIAGSLGLRLKVESSACFPKFSENRSSRRSA